MSSLDNLPGLVPAMRKLVELLVQRRYGEIERTTGGRRVSAAEVA
jgi:hypothetical protein